MFLFCFGCPVCFLVCLTADRRAYRVSIGVRPSSDVRMPRLYFLTLNGMEKSRRWKDILLANWRVVSWIASRVAGLVWRLRQHKSGMGREAEMLLLDHILREQPFDPWSYTVLCVYEAILKRLISLVLFVARPVAALQVRAFRWYWKADPAGKP